MPLIDLKYYGELKRDQVRYARAHDFIKTLADFKRHDLDHKTQLAFDVRALMFFEYQDVRWNAGEGAEVYVDKFGGPGNQRRFLALVESLPIRSSQRVS